ncbi:MAG: HU family DNA-binding protein [Spongiibacteraceae bacterium]|jgi:nucleoid DNA-binding protein|nr:HU family DNA-binding protein [Spongiibacteraceae bacterium]
MATKKAAPSKKAAVKKAPAKKAVAAPKTAAKKAAPKAAARKSPAITEKLTKSQILTHIAESTELSRRQVAAVLEELESLMARSVGKKGLGEFVLPGLLKITTVKKPARKARKGINPFTGEETVFKAKPASIAVKVRPLKKLKGFAEA